MSVFDKLLDSIKLNDDDYDEDNYLDEDLMDDEEGDFFDDDPMDDKPKKKFFEKFGRKKEDDLADADTSFDEEPVHTATPKTAAKAPAKQPAEKQRPVASSKITPMRSSRRANQASSMEVLEIAQRIIDFASGACYSLNGSLQKISSYIFVLGPSSVDITGDLQNILGGATPSVRAGY